MGKLICFILLTVMMLLPSTGRAEVSFAPRSGQTTCYDKAGYVIACAGTGQDGDTLLGLEWPEPRFTEPNPPDGTIIDNLTGLIWLKNADCFGAKTWDASLAAANNLAHGACGLSDGSSVGDWRVPNRNELMSLINHEKADLVTWLKGMGFTNVRSQYLSSSTSAKRTGYAWNVSFMYGGSVNSDSSKISNGYFWPVRSNPSQSAKIQLPRTGQIASYAAGDDGGLQKGLAWPAPRFTDLGDGTVYDKLTGLAWLKNANCFGSKTWDAALVAAKGLANGACSLSDGSAVGDWHLPNIKELESLIDLSQYSPALPVGNPFTNIDTYIYWSSTNDPYSPYAAWNISTSLYYGQVTANYKDVSYNIWPVRSGQFWALDSLLIGGDTNFGLRSLGLPNVTKSVTLRNTGATTQSIGSITIAGANADQFTLVPGGTIPCSSLAPTLAAGAKCTLSLSFAPTSAGNKTANLTVSANSKTIDIAITGSAIADTESPVISDFSMSATSYSLTVPVFIHAADNIGVTGYYLSEDEATPDVGALGWSATLPTAYAFADRGQHTLYAWVKDGNGNISNRSSATVNIVSYQPPIGSNGMSFAPRSGQTTCYDKAGYVIACASTGQDGDTLLGVEWPELRFTEPSPPNGTIIDNLTGLIWLKNADCFGAKTWDASLAAANNLAHGACGLSDASSVGDWRVPNRNELMSLINHEKADLATWLKGMGFTNVRSSQYWSSSTAAKRTGYAWNVNFTNGGSVDTYTNKINGAYFWPVRSNPSQSAKIQLPRTGQIASYAAGDDGGLQKGLAWPAPRFTDLGDGTVYDKLTGLVWLKNANCFGSKTWDATLVAAKGLANGACSLSDGSAVGDWHLPNIKELESLIDLSQYSPALPIGNPFANTNSWFWSSSTNIKSPTSAWYVDISLSYGQVTYNSKTQNYGLWPVRSGQFWALDSLLIGGDTNFGLRSLGLPNVTKSVTLRNTGATTQSIGSITIAGANADQFTLVPGGTIPCSSLAPTLAAGAKCTLSLSFAPTSAGNKTANLTVSANSKTIDIAITGSAIADTEAPVISDFSMSATSYSLIVPVFIHATDNIGVTGYYLSEDEATPDVGALGWSATLPTAYTFADRGQHTLYAWVKDGNGNISNRSSATVNIVSYQLNVTIYGNGTINVNPPGSYCNNGTCVYLLAPTTDVSLAASTDKYSLMTWQGDCSGINTLCIITMDNNKSVTATVTAAPKAKVVDKVFATAQAAYDDLDTTEGASVQMLEGLGDGPLIASRDISVSFKGGFDATYTSQEGRTFLQGGLIIKKGQVTVDRLIVK